MNTTRPVFGAVVQCTSGDLYSSRDPGDYCIKAARECGFFDKVILAVPDEPESAVFDALAEEWGVFLVKGAPHNVAARIHKAVELHQVDIVARLLLRAFYVDLDLVSDLFKVLREENADCVSLARDYNYSLGADLFTRNALDKAVQILIGGKAADAGREFAPWQLMGEDQGHFRTVEHWGTDMYPRERVRSIKGKLKSLLAENQVNYDWQFPASAYAFVSRHIRRNSRVLDIACGQGNGSRQLAENGFVVVGVDSDEGCIVRAQQRFLGVRNLEYVCADALIYGAEEPFDAVCSMHTMEHLGEQPQFLQRCVENLKPQSGKLYVEVPLLLPRPLGEPLNPWHKMEFSAEHLELLLTDSGFVIERRFGRDRGVFCDAAKSREVLHYHCSLAL